MRLTRQLLTAACAAIATLAAAGCADTAEPTGASGRGALRDKGDPSVDVDIFTPLDTIAVGDTATAIATGSLASAGSMYYYAADASVLAVTPSGQYRGAKLGRTRLFGILQTAGYPVTYRNIVVAAVSGARKTPGGPPAPVPTPTPPPPPAPTPPPTTGPYDIVLTLDTVAVGDTGHVAPTGSQATAAQSVYYTGDATILSVSASGVFTGHKLGRTRLYAVLQIPGYPLAYRDVVVGTTSGTRHPIGGTPTPPPVTPPVTPPPVTPPPVTSGSGKWVSGYYVGYQRGLYPEGQLDFSAMTHVIVGAVQATSTGGVTTDFYLDATQGPLMARAVASRAHAAGRKAILMLGGDGTSGPIRAALTTNAPAFEATLLRTMDNLGFDGLDIDWEPFPAADRPVVLQFLKDLRAARPGLILTYPIGYVGAYAPPDPWYAQVAPLVDQMNAMTYTMADNWGGWVSWHEAALTGEGPDHPTSITSTMNFYLKSGVPAAKLGIGIGAYGSCWQGVTDVRQPLTAASQHVVASDNAMSYATIMAQYYAAAAYRRDAQAQASYLSLPGGAGPQRCTLVSYEDPQAIAERGAYVKSAGLGGAIVWTVQQGHLPTAPAGQQDPLLAAAYTAIVK